MRQASITSLAWGMAGEQVLVEALVPQPAIEALHEAILHRLARRDVVPLDLGGRWCGAHTAGADFWMIVWPIFPVN